MDRTALLFYWTASSSLRAWNDVKPLKHVAPYLASMLRIEGRQSWIDPFPTAEHIGREASQSLASVAEELIDSEYNSESSDDSAMNAHLVLLQDGVNLAVFRWRQFLSFFDSMASHLWPFAIQHEHLAQDKKKLEAPMAKSWNWESTPK